MAIRIDRAKKDITYRYVPILERGEKDPFTVEIRPLTPKELIEIEDKMVRLNKDESISVSTGSYNWEVCKRGIVDWRNLLDERNREIPINRDTIGISDETLNYLPISFITEIANVIVGISKDPENAKLYLGEEEDDK